MKFREIIIEQELLYVKIIKEILKNKKSKN
jgi:hypothetical protein